MEKSPIQTAHAVERFRAGVTACLGLRLDEVPRSQLVEVLDQRVRATGLGCGDYLDVLLRPDTPEAAALARALTVAESYFFRDPSQVRAFVDVALPNGSSAARRGGRPVRVLSAGCAFGEEPYSLAIAVREASWAGPAVQISALDVDGVRIERAKAGRFSTWALRQVCPERRDRWFRRDGDVFQLDASVRAAVRFARGNLVDPADDVWRGGLWDVIFCRNVLMYFAPDMARRLARRLSDALLPGGYLFLGHAESLRGLVTGFDTCHASGTFYYRRRTEAPPHGDERAAWMTDIERASRRIAVLAETARRGQAAAVR
ncbi:MAG: protein-glutamate O-methyltransferase CheR [Acidimicrobiia bacterium]|nr:protein-glutamate O-methyltransferase CheR [Acidimicrobiia bacterium]